MEDLKTKHSFEAAQSGRTYSHSLSSSGLTRGSTLRTGRAVCFSQSGRTMVETMAVLAIMGVLSVAAYYGFRVMMDKHTANTILEDAQVAYIEIHSRSEGVPTEWNQITQNFKPVSEDLTFFVKRDPLNNDYVKVSGVEQKICYQLLAMQVKGKLAFYDTNDEKLTTCAATNDMVVAFNGQPAPAECATTGHCDAMGDYGEEGFQGYCNSTGRCHQCDTEYEEVNDYRTGCDCIAGAGLNCTTPTGAHWCCGEGLICGEEPNTCIDGGGLCSYRIYGNSDADTMYKTECVYSMSGIANINQYESDCYYTLGTNPAMKTEAIGNNNQTYANPVMTPNGTRGGCPANKYCALFWSDKADGTEDGVWLSKPTSIGASYTGRIYGKCQTLSAYDPTPKANYSEGNALLYASGGVRGGCPENKYCSIYWSKETWKGAQPTLAADSQGPFYGKCQTLNSYDPTPVVDTSAGGSSRYRVLQGCPVNEYCYLKWKENSCTDHGASDTGVFSGVCINMNTNSATCPYDTGS